MARIETWFNQDLQQAVKVQYIDGNVFSADNQGNVVGVNVFDGGEPATLGGTVSANVIRADGVTVSVTGTLSGNKCSVVLPQSAYTVPGVISIVIKLTDGSDITTVCAVVSNVYMSTTDSVVDPGTIIPSVETLIAEIEAAVASIPADYSSLWTSLAPTFSNSKAYSIGNYVTYDGGFYRFTTAHPAGSWDASHVTNINVGKELNLIKQVQKNIDTNIAGSATWTVGKYIDENGVIQDHSYMKYSSLIAVSHPVRHTIIVVPNTGTHQHRIHGYDADGNWKRELFSIPDTSQTAGVAYIRTFIAIDCDYIRFSIGRSTDTVWVIDEDTDVQAVLNASMKSEYSAMSNAVNILDGVEWTQHYNIDDSGQIVAYAKFEYSSLVPIKSNTGYTLALANLDLANEGNIRVIGYDDTQTFDKVLQIVPYANISAGQTMWRIDPQGCSYLRVAKYMNEEVAISEGNQLTTALLDSLMTKGGYTFEQGSIQYSTGANLSSSTRIRTPTYGDLSAQIIASDYLLFAVYLYDRDASFIGVWDGTKAVTGVTKWFNFVDMNKIYDLYKNTHPNLLYRLVARELNNSLDILPSSGKFVHFYSRANNMLYTTIGAYLTWAVCGASYDAGHYTGHSNTYEKAWGAVLARRCGNTLTNYSFAGATTKSFIESTTTHSLTQALSDPAKELYVLTYGGNDATHPDEVPVGSITDITGHTSGTPWNSTFYGNYGQIIESLMAHAPNAKFVMTTPSSPWYTTAQVTIDNAIREIADHYNLPMIEWESDDFMRSDLFIKTMSGGHPVPITYAGMAMAFERLFSKCVLEYPAYFTAIS